MGSSLLIMGHSIAFKHIPGDDINLTRFTTHKNWNINETEYSASGFKIRRAVIDRDWNVYDYPEGYATKKENLDGTDQRGLWYVINGMYYKEGKSNLDIEYSPYMVRTFHSTASYVQIPQQLFGESIKLGSVEIDYGSTIKLKDDGFGNIIDTALDTGSMVPSEELDSYWGFNDKFKYRKPGILQSTGSINDILGFNDLHYNNVTFEPGIKTTGTKSLSSGLMATLDGDGKIWSNKASDLNYKHDEDFAISLWTILPTSQSNVSASKNYLVSKEGTVVEKYIDNTSGKLLTRKRNYKGSKYPYRIQVHNQLTGSNGIVEVSRNDAQHIPTITSTTKINDNQQHNIIFNKTGSQIQLWIDGQNEGTIIDTTKDNTHNKSILSFGCNGHRKDTDISGSLDEIRFYGRGLSSTEIRSLSDMDFTTGSAYNTAIVGNVFYPQGTLVISDPRPKYRDVLLPDNFNYTSSVENNFNIKYRSTLTLTENEIVCRVGAGEFNFTTNPTIREYNDLNSSVAKPFVTGSDWHPYVTTIGLYDEHGRLLVIGKTAQPLPILEDVDTTLIVRYDE